MLAESFIERNGTVFQILAAVMLATVAGLIGRYFRRSDKPRKTLDYRVLSDVPILSHRPDDELKVMYRGDELNNPRLVRVRFENTGSECIRASEIIQQYRIAVGSAWMVQADVVDQSADDLVDLDADCTPGKNGIILELATLNRGDHFTLQILLDNDSSVDLTVTGRVENQSRPSRDLNTVAERRRQILDGWSGLAIGAMMIGFGLLILKLTNASGPGPWLAAPSMILGLATLIGGWVTFAPTPEEYSRLQPDRTTK